MTVFYTASYYGKDRYQKYYDMVRVTLEATKIKLISPEKNNYLDVLSEGEKKKIGDPKLVHYEAIRRGIAQSDAVVIEISNEDFQLGHEATLALLNKKPVLCLSVFEDFGLKIQNRFFFAAKYDEYSIGEIIEEFITKAKKGHLTERFNLFLSPTQTLHLEVASQKVGLNKSEYIRQLIEEDRKRL